MLKKTQNDPSNESALPVTKQASQRHALRRTKFVANYIESGNATQAAKDAGYSLKTARTQASDLLTNPDIQKAIANETQAIYSEASLKATLNRFLAKPDDDKLKLQAVELAMRNLAMLTDRQKVEVAELKPIDEIAKAASESLSELTIDKDGIKAEADTVKVQTNE